MTVPEAMRARLSTVGNVFVSRYVLAPLFGFTSYSNHLNERIVDSASTKPGAVQQKDTLADVVCHHVTTELPSSADVGVDSPPAVQALTVEVGTTGGVASRVTLSQAPCTTKSAALRVFTATRTILPEDAPVPLRLTVCSAHGRAQL